MFIGRDKEKQELMNAYNSSESEFVAVYGRRRVGKTYLVRQTFKDNLTFSCSGQASGNMSNQLFGWYSSLKDAGMNGSKCPEGWLEAFDMLKELIKSSQSKKKVIFIDEMPWLDTPKAGFVNAIEFFWNGWASGRNDVLLIVCGSATSWIVNKLFKNHGGLHNRVTYRILLEPFTLNECERYCIARGLMFSRYDILELYMVLGGIPFYWSLLETGKSVAQNIDNLFFASNGKLRYEFDELYNSLFKSPQHYVTIVKALEENKAGLTRKELIKKSKMPSSGTISTRLSDLEHCGFIKVIPAYRNKNGSIYQLIDNFTLFYFKFMSQNVNNDDMFWSHNYLSPVRSAWVGLAFERVCFQHIKQIKQALGISGIVANIFCWQTGPSPQGEAGAQIDMLIDRADNMVNICEMKFSNQEYIITNDDINNLRHKALRFSQSRGINKSINLTLITVVGLAHSAHWGEIQNVITASDLFAI